MWWNVRLRRRQIHTEKAEGNHDQTMHTVRVVGAGGHYVRGECSCGWNGPRMDRALGTVAFDVAVGHSATLAELDVVAEGTSKQDGEL